MPYCAVSNCRNNSINVNKSSGGVSFHRFPKDPDLKEKWLDATGRKNWFPTKYSTICSMHFLEDDYTESTRWRKLDPTAYPTVDVWRSDNVSKQACSAVQAKLDKPKTQKNVIKEVPCEDTKEKPTTQQWEIKVEVVGGEKTEEATTQIIKLEEVTFEDSTEKPSGRHVEQIEVSCDPINISMDSPLNRALQILDSDTPGEKKLKRKLIHARKLFEKQKLEIKKIRERNRRQNKKILKLQTLLQEFKELNRLQSTNDKAKNQNGCQMLSPKCLCACGTRNKIG